MKRFIMPLAGAALLAGFGVAGAAEPTALNAAAMDNITAGNGNCDSNNNWQHKSMGSTSGNGSSGKNGSSNSQRTTTQSNSSFLSPQVNAAALNNINLLTYGTGSQSVSQSNSSTQGNIISGHL